MPRRYVDLSIPIENGVDSDPPGSRPQVTYIGHHDSVGMLAAAVPGLTPDDLPEGQGWAVERIALSTHNGTHMDAPWRFHATQDSALEGGARRAMTIDELPLDWCQRPGVKLDFRRFPDGYVATAADVREELDRVGCTLRP